MQWPAVHTVISIPEYGLKLSCPDCFFIIKKPLKYFIPSLLGKSMLSYLILPSSWAQESY